MVRVNSHIYSTAPSLRALQVHTPGPGGLQLVHQLDFPHPSLGLSTLGERIYVAAGNDGLLIFDVQQPEQPRLLGIVNLAGPVLQATPFLHQGRHWVAASLGSEGLALVNVSDASAPLVSSPFSPFPSAPEEVVHVAGDGRRMAVADNLNGTSFFDISDPQFPQVLGRSNGSRRCSCRDSLPALGLRRQLIPRSAGF